jgi:hypothetical protein
MKTEERIEKIEKRVDKLDNEINGNNGKGLKQMVTKLEVQNDMIIKSMDDRKNIDENIRKSLSGLLDFQKTWEGMQLQKEKDAIKTERKRTNNRWLVGTLIGIILTLLGYLII